LPCITTQPCQNNGNCTNDSQGDYTCSCLEGYTGINCQTGKQRIIYKFSALIISLIFLHKCFFGKVLPCDLNSNQCQNGGTCQNDYQGGHTCTCDVGYEGDNCEMLRKWIEAKKF